MISGLRGFYQKPKCTIVRLTCMILIVIRLTSYYCSCYLDLHAEMIDNIQMKNISRSVMETYAEIGSSLKTWRILYELKATQVADRAGISLGTLNKIENGDPSVSTAAFLEVIRSLGLLDVLAESLDPLNSDLGRARVTENMPKRIR